MTLNKCAGIVGSLTVLIGAVLGVTSYFQTKAEAAEVKQQLTAKQEADKAEVRQELKSTVLDLNLKIARANIARLNAKARLTADEKVELEFNRAMVIDLQKRALAQ
jgi:hypothetical protein